jgi:DNA repair protein RecO (recombination protein O)
MLQKIQGIVLFSVKYSESGLVTHIYTNKFGRQSFITNSTRKKKGLTNAYLFHPLSLLEIEVDYKENRDIQKIIEARYFYIFNQIYFDVRRSTIAMFLGEILDRSIRESEPNIKLFEFINNAVQLLDIQEGIENFHLVFLAQLSKFLGFHPGVDFELKNRNLLAPEFHRILTISLTEINTLNFSKSIRRELLNLILELYKEHITETATLRSLKVLRELFD